MNRTPSFSTAGSRLMLCAVLAAACTVQPALALERKTEVTGPRGQALQRDTTRQQGDVSTTTTGPKGQQVQRTVDRSKSGTEASVTGPQGQSLSRSTSLSKSASSPQ